MEHVKQYFHEASLIASKMDCLAIEKMALALSELKAKGGRLFLIGVGGSAANCSHAVNDFRKLCGIETYTPVDNVSELTARTNDDGWDSVFSEWLKVSRLSAQDAILIFSVGGGDLEKRISGNIIQAIDLAKDREATILAILGRDTGYAAKHADIAVIVPAIEKSRITPHSEAFQGVIWHCLVSHPSLQKNATKWESVLHQTV